MENGLQPHLNPELPSVLSRDESMERGGHKFPSPHDHSSAVPSCRSRSGSNLRATRLRGCIGCGATAPASNVCTSIRTPSSWSTRRFWDRRRSGVYSLAAQALPDELGVARDHDTHESQRLAYIAEPRRNSDSVRHQSPGSWNSVTRYSHRRDSRCLSAAGNECGIAVARIEVCAR